MDGGPLPPEKSSIDSTLYLRLTENRWLQFRREEYEQRKHHEARCEREGKPLPTGWDPPEPFVGFDFPFAPRETGKPNIRIAEKRALDAIEANGLTVEQKTP